jgi:hypothetical protein
MSLEGLARELLSEERIAHPVTVQRLLRKAWGRRSAARTRRAFRAHCFPPLGNCSARGLTSKRILVPRIRAGCSRRLGSTVRGSGRRGSWTRPRCFGKLRPFRRGGRCWCGAIHSCLLHAGKHVRISVHHLGNVGVLQLFLDDLRVYVFGKQERGAGVPEVVGPDYG